MFIKRIVMAAGVATIAAAVPFAAQSADIPQYTPPPVVTAVPAWDWSGFYVGLNAGYGWGQNDGVTMGFTDPGGTWFGPCLAAGSCPGGLSHSSDGFVGGAQIGYNWQIDQFLIGGEADISWADIQGSTGIANGTVSTRADWLSTVRARAGVAIDRVLIYGTGGIAFTDMKTELNGPVGFSSDSQNLTGWTIGAGVELALTENLSMKGEYLYTDFGDKDYGIGGTTVPVSLDGSTVRLGLNYRLNLF